MNNLEIECLEFAEDILFNRPCSTDGNTVKYNEQDCERIINVLTAQKKKVENNESRISPDCYRLLIEIYDRLIKLVSNRYI